MASFIIIGSAAALSVARAYFAKEEDKRNSSLMMAATFLIVLSMHPWLNPFNL